MEFQNLSLSQNLLDRLTMKSGYLVNNEVTLNRAIEDLLDDYERLSRGFDELFADFMASR